MSYTTFKYSGLKISPDNQHLEGNVEVSFDVENSGSMKGDEVAQLYINEETTSVTTYTANLRGFSRIRLLPGEKKNIKMILCPDDLTLINRNYQRVVEPGKFKVMVGSSSEDIRLNGSFIITE